MKTDQFLTPRLREIILYLAQGYSVDEICSKMHIIRQGIYNHLQRAYDILGVKRNVHALVSWWYQVNYEINLKDIIDVKSLSKDAKGIVAGLLLLLAFPSEILPAKDIYRSVRRGWEIETVCRRGRGRETSINSIVKSVSIAA